MVDIGTPNVENGTDTDMMQASSAICVDPNANNATVPTGDSKGGRDSRLDDLVALLGENMPHDQNSPYYSYLSSFMSLRLTLLKPSPTPDEAEQQGTLLSSYSSYMSSGRAKNDIAVMIARDYMFLKQQSQSQPQPSPQLQSLVSNHSMHPSMEHLSLPVHPNSIVTNSLTHPGAFISFPSTQGNNNGTMQQQYSTSIDPLQQNQRPSQQHLDAVESSNNGHMNLPSSNMSTSNSSRKSE